MRTAAIILWLGVGSSLSGCIAAAAIPVGAAALLGKEHLDSRSPRQDASIPPRDQRVAALPDVAVVRVLPATELPPPSGTIAPASRAAKPTVAPDDYDVLTRYLFAQSDARARGVQVASVVLVPEADPAKPEFTVCARMPLAMVVALGTADPTALGTRDPQLVETITVARMAGIEVVYMSDRSAADAAALSAALDTVGLGPARHGDTLWMAGDRGSTGRDSLRWKIASRNCIVALLGRSSDQFTQIVDDRDVTPGTASLDALRGKGWFLVPDALASSPDKESE